MRVRILIATFLIGAMGGSAPSTARAWSEAGHRIIASIVFHRLSADERHRFAELLKSHPRYQEDFAVPMAAAGLLSDEQREEWLFQQASLWPDIVRGFPEDLLEIYHHSTWHYIDFPHFLSKSAGESFIGLVTNIELDAPATAEPAMNAVQTIRFARQHVADPRLPASERAVLLCWLLHVAADIHQPLHSGSFYSANAYPNGDQGGNSIKDANGLNLHAVWDQLLGARGDFATTRQVALGMLAGDEVLRRGLAAQVITNEQVWVEESHKLSLAVAYDSEVLAYLRVRELGDPADESPGIQLSQEYLSKAQRVGHDRAVEGAFRLAAVLGQIKLP